MASWYFTLLVAAVVYTVFKLKGVGRRPKGFPPGPPTLPIIGNLHQIPAKKQYLQLQKWAQTYGPVYSLILGTQVMIVLSADIAVKDLLDKRSAIYSSRPEMYIGNQVASSGLRMVLMEYGETWRQIRRIFHGLLHLKAAKSYMPYQDLESTSMMIAVLEEPDLIFDHIRRYTNSFSTQIVYGFRTPRIDDPRLLKLYKNTEDWSHVTASAGAALLDAFPVLRGLPEVARPLYRHARRVADMTVGLSMEMWGEIKGRVKEGTAKPCFCVGVVKAQQDEGHSDKMCAMMAGTAMEASSDTSASTLAGFIQAMVLYPEAQKAAQATADEVWGEEFPSLADFENPKAQYIRACVKETLRWMPTAILGIPHSPVRDDEYMGYKIPKGAAVVYNVWAIHMDPNRHANPRSFDPSRYMDDFTSSSESAQNPDVSKRDHFTFGAGRRVCSGMHVVDRSLFLVIARLVWAFDFGRAVDENGREIVPDQDDLVGGLLVQPRPFKMRITPRSEARAAKVREAWEGCKKLLDEEEQWRGVPIGMPYTTYEMDTGGEGV
ncbi:cytochrome P450 [Canariomyces notabilis]|uniref:Cytochrome P450 n=1 Tax=Canariomyces notabilis TaxID=2074819 RepID=A0AAN6QH97_9PEZI|nr:cytochrome P450 [Canariomyces arenarius]